MEILHEAEEPGSFVATGLLETLPCGSLFDRVRELVLLHAAVSKLALAVVEPASCQRCVGQHPETDNGDEKSSGTFEKEKPVVCYSGLDA